jgi:hypothetical protein
MSILNWPGILDHIDQPELIFPSDVVQRASDILASMKGGLGAYTHSKGLLYVREAVARFLLKRDGFSSDPENIFLTDGASPAIKSAISMLVKTPQDGVMLPNPQYPLYSATMDEVNAHFFLNVYFALFSSRVTLSHHILCRPIIYKKLALHPPRCVCVCVCMYVYMCICVYRFLHSL